MPRLTVMHVREKESEESDEFASACLLKGESVLKDLGHEPETRKVSGDVVNEVIRDIRLENYDLVVLGAQGFGKSGAFNILSHKALQIIKRTTRPVLLFRPKA